MGAGADHLRRLVGVVDAAAACFPPDPFCVSLRAMLAAGADGKFSSLRGEPDFADDPYEFDSTVPGFDWSCTITIDEPEEYVASELSCEVLRSYDTAAIETGYQEVGQAIASCVPDWSPTEFDNGVTFSPPDGGPSVRLWAGRFDLGGTTTYYLELNVEGTLQKDW